MKLYTVCAPNGLRRLCLFAAMALTIPCAGLVAQSPSPSFEVATIKPIAADARPTHGWIGMQFRPDAVEFSWQTLPDLLCYAYGYGAMRFDGQVAGLPDWAVTQRYDIVAKMDAENAAKLQKMSWEEQDQLRQRMVRSLLAERFSLTLHRGTKEIPAYELVVAKGGAKMTSAPTDGSTKQGIRWGKDTSVVQGYSMKTFADLLAMPAAQVGRPVVDKTGLTGAYSFDLDWSIYSASAAAQNEATSIFTALGKVGLKLQPSTAPFQTVIVDHVEPPSQN